MPYIYPEEVEHVRRLLLEEKTEEAFEILEGFEKTDNFTLRFHGGYLYFCLGNFEKVHEIDLKNKIIIYNNLQCFSQHLHH